jgi:hypothetical protein
MWKKEGLRMDEITPVSDLLAIYLQKNKKMQTGFIQAHWQEIVGELVKYSQVHSLKEDTLNDFVENPTIIHFINMNTGIYLEKIQNLFQKTHQNLQKIPINNLKFLLKSKKNN